MSRPSRPVTILFIALAVWPIDATLAQETPLTRTFVGGHAERYQVTVTIRVETHGISTEKIGEKTYATPFTHHADGQLSWRAGRRMTSVKEDGSAVIAETLDQFQANCRRDPDSEHYDSALQESVENTCADWQNISQMNYEEEKFGLIRGLPVLASELSNTDSSLLTFWIRRAFRPSVILPKTPIRFGVRTEHKIPSQAGGPDRPKGQESTEWLEAASDPPSATLHVSQDLKWTDPPQPSRSSNAGGPPARRQLFFADSLNTISLLDGSLLKASRSATRETKEVLDPVPGLPDVPLFGSKLTITVTMLRLP
jgi:hypothetical protein